MVKSRKEQVLLEITQIQKSIGIIAKFNGAMDADLRDFFSRWSNITQVGLSSLRSKVEAGQISEE